MRILLSNKNECGNCSDAINGNNGMVMVMDEGDIDLEVVLTKTTTEVVMVTVEM